MACLSSAEYLAASKAAQAAIAAYDNAASEYVTGYSTSFVSNGIPQKGTAAYKSYGEELFLVNAAVKKAGKYKWKNAACPPKKAAAVPENKTTPAPTPPAKTESGDSVSPTHSSNRHKRHKCREDEPCAGEGTNPERATSGETSAPASYGTTVVVPADNGTVTEPDEHRPDYPSGSPSEPGSPDVPIPPDTGPH